MIGESVVSPGASKASFSRRTRFGTVGSTGSNVFWKRRSLVPDSGNAFRVERPHAPVVRVVGKHLGGRQRGADRRIRSAHLRPDREVLRGVHLDFVARG